LSAWQPSGFIFDSPAKAFPGGGDKAKPSVRSFSRRLCCVTAQSSQRLQ
jgi:hypothetical protein